jgi:hypothetical protein
MSSSKNIGFTVEDNSSEAEALAALESLKRMARYGRLAEKVLREIKTKGYYDGLAPMLSTRRYGDPKSATVSFRRLPQKLPISREEFPSIHELKVLVSPFKPSTKLHESKSAAILVSGPCLIQTESGKPEYEIRPDSFPLGYVRVSKTRTSWGQNGRSPIPIPKNRSGHGSKHLLEHFSEALSREVCNTAQSHDEAVAKTWDLRKAIAQALLDEGVSDRLLGEILSISQVSEIMSA